MSFTPCACGLFVAGGDDGTAAPCPIHPQSSHRSTRPLRRPNAWKTGIDLSFNLSFSDLRIRFTVNPLADHHGDVIRLKLADMIPGTPGCLR